jgi:hypothetical protein
MGVTLGMFLAGLVLIFIARGKAGFIGAVGGALIAIAFGLTFPYFMIEARSAFSKSWNATLAWGQYGFSDATTIRLTASVLFMIIAAAFAYRWAAKQGYILIAVIAAIIVLIGLGGIFPHLLTASVDYVSALAHVTADFFTTAFRQPKF